MPDSRDSRKGFRYGKLAVMMLRFMVTVFGGQQGQGERRWLQKCFGLEHNEAKKGIEERTEYGY